MPTWWGGIDYTFQVFQHTTASMTYFNIFLQHSYYTGTFTVTPSSDNCDKVAIF